MTSVRRSVLAPLGGVAAAGVAGVAYAGLVERNLFTLRRVAVPVLPEGTRPLRVLQVSDLHLVPRQERRVAWVRGLAALEPDLVVNTGDNLAAMDAVPAALRAMEPLLERPGVFVLGSNDYYAPTLKNPARYLAPSYRDAPPDRQGLPVGELVAGLREGGWVDLDNARTRLDVAGVPLELVGVDDPHIDRDRYAVVSAPAADDVALTVGVVHAPYQRVLDAMTADGARLVVAGHTHGGQLALPALGALVTNCDLPTDRAKGLSRWWPGAGVGTHSRWVPQRWPRRRGPAGAPRRPAGDAGGAMSAGAQDAAYLHVSAGLGTSPYAPVRFACRPEATLLTLVPPGH
ncbi:MAG TPA: metallophosphoesterase [Dermatophilaceae bacterium]|nr:metallophosphoesterase [Dermatophilaceae bacterium]